MRKVEHEQYDAFLREEIHSALARCEDLSAENARLRFRVAAYEIAKKKKLENVQNHVDGATEIIEQQKAVANLRELNAELSAIKLNLNDKKNTILKLKAEIEELKALNENTLALLIAEKKKNHSNIRSYEMGGRMALI